MSKETERIINRINAEHLHRLKMKEQGDEIVKNKAKQLEEDFNLKDVGDPKFKTKRFLKSLLNKTLLKHEVDPDKYIYPYILLQNPDDVFLVLERNSIKRIKTVVTEEYGVNKEISYEYIRMVALGYKKEGDEFEVGFFNRNENDPYIFEDPDRGIFLPLDAGMLFTKTVREEEIIPTLALAMASYEYNKGKPLNDQITFPSEI